MSESVTEKVDVLIKNAYLNYYAKHFKQFCEMEKHYKEVITTTTLISQNWQIVRVVTFQSFSFQSACNSTYVYLTNALY